MFSRKIFEKYGHTCYDCEMLVLLYFEASLDSEAKAK